jgi:hypothetical protein
MAAAWRAVLAMMLLAAPAAAAGQAAVQPPTRTSVPGPVDPPAAERAPSAVSDLFSFERIRRELGRPEVIRLSAFDDGRPVYRVEVEGQLPKFTDFLAEGERLGGPVAWGGLTHNEFLSMVTPKQAQPYGAFTNGDLLQVLATSFLTGLAFQGAAKGGGALVQGVRGAIRSRQERAAREEVYRVVQELERRREEEARKKEEEEAKKKVGGDGSPKPPQVPPP